MEWAELGNAIVSMAVQDYRKALQRNDEQTIKECEKFFHNERLMSIYCKYDGSTLMRLVQEQIRR